MTFPVPKGDVKFAEQRKQFFDDTAEQYANPGPFKKYYNDRLRNTIQFNVPKGSKVIEIGCGTGDLLAYLEPSYGVGVDFSEKTLEIAKERHPNLTFISADAESITLDDTFDYIVLSNLIGDLVDIQRVFKNLGQLCDEKTQLIITDYNYLWNPLVKVAEKLGIKPRQRIQNWLELPDVTNLLSLTGFDTVKCGRDMLCPLPIPVLSNLVNDFVGTLPGFSRLNINEIMVARPTKKQRHEDKIVSVIVACKDEKGNIEELVKTVPKMGLGTELIFVDGHSDDGTVEEIERCIGIKDKLNPQLKDIRVMVQPGKGKGDAVRMGFDDARGDVLMILDADITVPSEDLPKFYNALIEGKGDFINGSRLCYPMEDEAMRFLNMLGNHFFGWVFSYLLDQRLTDTLCGTKVLFKSDYEAIKKGRAFFGDFDPFGDFDLLFGAAKQNLKICEVPIRYRNREYGDIKIDRFKHGLLLLKMSALAFKRFKLHKGIK